MTPLDEAIVLWSEMAITGSSDKGGIIKRLFNRRDLLKPNYLNGCPLCAAHTCVDCPWPGYDFVITIGRAQCCIVGPYKKWVNATNTEDRKRWSRCIWRMLREIKRRNVRDETSM